MFIIKIVLFLFAFLGTSFADVPEWFYKRSNKNDNIIYSAGIGKNKNEAINDALNGIYKEIYIIIDGKDEAKNDHDYIKLPKYILVEKAKSNENVYVLISISKSELFNIQLDSIEKDFNLLNKQVETLNAINDILRIEQYENIFKIIDKIKKQIAIIQKIKEFKDGKYTKYFEKIYDDYEKLVKNISIRIELNAELKEITDDIVKYIESKNIKIDEKSNNILSIDIIKSENKLNDKFMVSDNLLFILKNNNEILKYNNKEFACVSDVNFDECHNKILFDIKQYLNEKIVKNE